MGSVGFFNGDLNAGDDDKHVKDVVAALGMTPREGIEAGVYWISDLGESDGL